MVCSHLFLCHLLDDPLDPFVKGLICNSNHVCVTLTHKAEWSGKVDYATFNLRQRFSLVDQLRLSSEVSRVRLIWVDKVQLRLREGDSPPTAVFALQQNEWCRDWRGWGGNGARAKGIRFQKPWVYRSLIGAKSVSLLLYTCGCLTGKIDVLTWNKYPLTLRVNNSTQE